METTHPPPDTSLRRVGRLPRRADLTTLPLHALSWKTSEDVETSLSTLYAYAEARAEEVIDWYANAKRSKAVWSRTLRFAAIVLTTLGGLAPLLASAGLVDGAGGLAAGQLGYVALGLAAGCVGLDRFFGFSSGWMRYITTSLHVQKALSEFRIDWARMAAGLRGATPDVEQVEAMLQRIRAFVAGIDAHVEEETQTWIAEFRTSLRDLEQSARAQMEAAQPGAIELTVPNGAEAHEGFTVSLDGLIVGRARGTRFDIGYVPPGPHRIGVTGTVGGRTLDAMQLVNVPPGLVARSTLSLPVDPPRDSPQA